MWPFVLATALALGRVFGPGMGTTPPAAVGRYALVAVGDHALPALWQESDLGNGVRLRAYWVGGLAELRADLSYRLSLTLRASGPGVYGQPVVSTIGGTFRELPGGRLELSPARGGTVYWQLMGDTLTSRALVRGSGEARSRPAEFVFVRAVAASSPVPIP